MATITIKGYMVARHYEWMQAETPPVWVFSQHHDGKIDSPDMVAAIPYEVTFDAPAINVVAGKVQALKAAKAKALEQFQNTVAQINLQLSKLQALTNEVPA